MHITNQKLSFNIFRVRHLQNLFMEHDLYIIMIFGIKENIYNFDPYSVFFLLLLLQIYSSDLRLLLCSRVTYKKIKKKRA